MPHDQPRAEPPVAAVRDAARALLDRSVTDVAPIPRGVNAVYRIALADGSHAVLKVPLYASERAFLAETRVLSRVGRETGVPVPDVLGTSRADDGPLDAPCYVMERIDGRQVETLLELPPDARERLAREAGAHLAAIHDLPVTTAYGHLEAADGELAAADPFDTWDALFADLVADVTAAMRGEGSLADAHPRFADLAPAIREALTGDRPSPGGHESGDRSRATGESPSPSLVVRDYRPVNLVLAPADGADPLVRGVFDLSGLAGDPLFDVAKTEDSLIDVPLGGTAAAAALRSTFRTAYADHRATGRPVRFDSRYPSYRLYARAFRLKAFDYSAGFARESDEDAVARRWRSFVAERLAEIRDARGERDAGRFSRSGTDGTP